jgi:replicative DNA helicase
MADAAWSMLSKIVLDEDLSTATRGGVRLDWFEDLEHKRVFKWMLEYNSRYGGAPTREAISAEFPAYQLARCREPYEYYLDRFRSQRERSILVDGIVDADTLLQDDDHKGAQRRISQALLQLGREVCSLSDVNVTRRTRARYEAYDEARMHVGELSGIQTGFPTLDFSSGGYLDQQFILFGGGPKHGKSFLLMRSAIAAQDAGYSVLFVTFEMSQREQLARYDAMVSGVNANHVVRNYLDDEEMKKLKKGIALRRNLPDFVISADISATTTVSGLSGKVDEYQPDILFIDGCYLMENEIGAKAGEAAAYTAVSRGLKRLAQRIDKPVIGTTQALSGKMGKDGIVTLNSLGWTSAWAQDADVILGVERLPDINQIRLRVVGGRNVSPCEISIICNWEESDFNEADFNSAGLDEDVDDEG